MKAVWSALGGRIAWLLAGAVGVYVLWPQSDPVMYPEVIVPAPRIIEREPSVEIRWRDRIVYRDLPPVQVATSLTGGEDVVGEFCRPTVIRVTEDSTAAPPPPAVLLRSFSVRDPLIGPDRLTTTGILSTGGLRQWDHRPRGSFQAIVSGDSLIVRSSRWWWIEDWMVPLGMLGLGLCLGGLC